MPSIVRKLTDIQATFDALARQHRVVGASLGVMSGDDFVEFATGLANRNTGVPVTPETLFQIGSNTKLYTTTLLMQLVDQGLVDLDAHVTKYVPELQLDDPTAADEITVRMLVTHTSGIQGDFFDDHGRGDDCLEHHIGAFAKLDLIHRPWKLWSYCNTGFSLAGRLIEKVTGKYWHEVLRERLLAPIGASATTVLLEEMIAHRYAVGHVAQPGSPELRVPPRVMMSRAQAPAGSLTSSTPREVLNRFVRMHLDGGRGPDGSQVLSPASVEAMQTVQFTLDGPEGVGRTMGLGWMVNDWGGHRVIGHGGGTIGQLSFLQVMPDERFGVFLATNSTTGGALWRDLGGYLFSELAGVEMPGVPKPPATPPSLDLAKYTGRFERLSVQQEFTVENEELVLSLRNTGPLSDPNAPPQRIPLRPISKDAFYARGAAGELIVGFLEFDKQGRPAYAHMGGRAARKVADEKPAKKAATTAAAKDATKGGARARNGRRG